eukprot:SAG25_NODE_3623_length_1019_cov_1.270652_2_plen_162_part_00
MYVEAGLVERGVIAALIPDGEHAQEPQPLSSGGHLESWVLVVLTARDRARRTAAALATEPDAHAHYAGGIARDRGHSIRARRAPHAGAQATPPERTATCRMNPCRTGSARRWAAPLAAGWVQAQWLVESRTARHRHPHESRGVQAQRPAMSTRWRSVRQAW